MVVRARMADIERTYTNEEFEQMPKFEGRYELLEGKIVEKAMPGHEHARIAKRIHRHLTFLDPEEKLGEMLFDATYEIRQGWMPIPDLGFTVIERVSQATAKAVKVVPDLVVEIHSPRDLERERGREEAANKIKQYQAAGVRIIWSIHPRAQTVEVYHPDSPHPVKVLNLSDELDGEDVIKGFKLSIGKLFE